MHTDLHPQPHQIESARHYANARELLFEYIALPPAQRTDRIVRVFYRSKIIQHMTRADAAAFMGRLLLGAESV